MYRYMHATRLINSVKSAQVRPYEVSTAQTRLRDHLDLAEWHARLAPANVPKLESDPAISSGPVFQIDLRGWQQRLESANARSATIAPIVVLEPGEEAAIVQHAA